MTYEEIRKRIRMQKESHWHEKMRVTYFGRFAVMEKDGIDAIIIDSEIASLVASRKWCLDSHGYPIINLGGKSVRLFDVVMAHCVSEKPSGCYIDHINQDKLDNRVANLRFVTPQENARNMPLKSDNTSGYTGVSKTKNGTYRAYITIGGKQRNLGYYKTIEEAASARREAEDRLNFKTRPATIKEACGL